MTARPAEPVRRALADADDAVAFGERLAGLLRAGDVVCLTGPLGSGKTTLVRGMASGLGVRGPVTSPTFVIARSHPSLRGGVGLIHVDAYRLAGSLELDDLDLGSEAEDAVTVVEWGEGLVETLTESFLHVRLDREPGVGESEDGSSGPRQVSVCGVGPRWEEVHLHRGLAVGRGRT